MLHPFQALKVVKINIPPLSNRIQALKVAKINFPPLHNPTQALKVVPPLLFTPWIASHS